MRMRVENIFNGCAPVGAGFDVSSLIFAHIAPSHNTPAAKRSAVLAFAKRLCFPTGEAGLFWRFSRNTSSGNSRRLRHTS